jgi:hypothetical protein
LIRIQGMRWSEVVCEGAYCGLAWVAEMVLIYVLIGAVREA